MPAASSNPPKKNREAAATDAEELLAKSLRQFAMPLTEAMLYPHAMQLLPVDYHKEVARELVAFFHTFYRFGAATNVFNLQDPRYQQFLHNLLFGSLAIGTIVFITLCIIVVRRCFMHIRSAFVRRYSTECNTVEISAVVLLTVIAISSLSGLLGEAQVDYSAGVVQDAMANMTTVFATAKSSASDSVVTSELIRGYADGLVTSFNESDLPSDAFQLLIESSRLLHAAKDLTSQTDELLPNNYSDVAKDWDFSYFMLKSTTNAAIMSVALASFLSISSIGWSMVSPLRVSILVLLSVIPVSHTLIGVYLSSAIMTADFCAAPLNSTKTLLETNEVVNYYLECPVNATIPFDNEATEVHKTLDDVASLQTKLEVYAKGHGEIGQRMKREFLDPIGQQINAIDQLLAKFNASQSCQDVSVGYQHAATVYCEYGMIGFFSMWTHQILLCLFLFVGVVTSVLAYERVQIREIHMDMRYHLVSSYEEDGVENVYLSAD